MVISHIIAPLVGGVIGYITNDLAIRMLFRPHEKKFIFGVHIPLTPGVIPKEKDRIAESIGKVISENLMNPETLSEHLLSEHMVGKLHSSVESFITKQQTNAETVAEFLGHYLSEEEIKGMAVSVNKSLTRQIHDKLSDQKLGDKIAHVAMKNALDGLLDDNNSEEVLKNLPSIAKSIGKSVLGMVLAALQEPVENLLSRNINDILKSNGDEIVSKLINEEADRLLSTPMQQLLHGKEDLMAKAPDKIVSLYKQAITENLPRILESVNIAAIVSNRIKDMNVEEAEELILQVMKKELKAIVWLGAGLGFLMGFVNVLI
jgi:uncharacterized membrane protein YheB (UPF0754 family)